MIIDVLASDRGMQAFLNLPADVYRNDSNWVVESKEKTKASLLREVFRSRQKAFVFQANGRTLARLVTRVSPTLTDHNKRPIGMIGFFEAQNEPSAVDELLSEGITWLRQRGVGTIVGPLDGDTWHRYRFNVGPHEEPPYLMEPYNKPYYDDLWQRAGFEILESYYSKVVKSVAEAAEPMSKIHARVLKRGYRIRSIDMMRFEEEIGIIYQLSTEIFAGNVLYEPISREDFLALYRPARSLVDPDLVLIAETSAREPVGFAFSVIDYHAAVASMRGETGWLAKLRFLWNRPKANAVNVKSLGVLPEYRQSGVGAALVCQTYQTIHEKGFRRANLCLIREGNPSGRLDGNMGLVSRRYHLYHLPVKSE